MHSCWRIIVFVLLFCFCFNCSCSKALLEKDLKKKKIKKKRGGAPGNQPPQPSIPSSPLRPRARIGPAAAGAPFSPSPSLTDNRAPLVSTRLPSTSGRLRTGLSRKPHAETDSMPGFAIPCQTWKTDPYLTPSIAPRVVFPPSPRKPSPRRQPTHGLSLVEEDIRRCAQPLLSEPSLATRTPWVSSPSPSPRAHGLGFAFGGRKRETEELRWALGGAHGAPPRRGRGRRRALPGGSGAVRLIIYGRD